MMLKKRIGKVVDWRKMDETCTNLQAMERRINDLEAAYAARRGFDRPHGRSGGYFQGYEQSYYYEGVRSITPTVRRFFVGFPNDDTLLTVGCYCAFAEILMVARRAVVMQKEEFKADAIRPFWLLCLI